MVGKRFWLWGATILPPMNSPYRGSILTWSMDSGAGAYSKVRFANSVGARFAIAISVDREVVTGLVGAGALLLDLHQHVVEQRGRAKPEPLWSHPLGSERLVQHNEVGDRLLGGADTARGLDADRAPGLAHEVADRLHHHQAHGQGRGGLHLAGGRLDEVGARGHREDARPAHVVVRAELTRLEDHLEVRGPACLLDGDDLLVDLLVVAGEKRAAVDHHVHLVRARREGAAWRPLRAQGRCRWRPPKGWWRRQAWAGCPWRKEPRPCPGCPSLRAWSGPCTGWRDRAPTAST